MILHHLWSHFIAVDAYLVQLVPVCLNSIGSEITCSRLLLIEWTWISWFLWESYSSTLNINLCLSFSLHGKNCLCCSSNPYIAGHVCLDFMILMKHSLWPGKRKSKELQFTVQKDYTGNLTLYRKLLGRKTIRQNSNFIDLPVVFKPKNFRPGSGPLSLPAAPSTNLFWSISLPYLESLSVRIMPRDPAISSPKRTFRSWCCSSIPWNGVSYL